MCSSVTGQRIDPAALVQFQAESMQSQMSHNQNAESTSKPASPSSSPTTESSITNGYGAKREIALQNPDPYKAANSMSCYPQFNPFKDESFWIEWSKRHFTVHGIEHVRGDVWLRCSHDSLGHRICKISSRLFGTKAFATEDTFRNPPPMVEETFPRLEYAVRCGLEIAAVKLFNEYGDKKGEWHGWKSNEYGFERGNSIISAALDQDQPHVATELALESIKDHRRFLPSDLLVRIFKACIDTHSTAALRVFSTRKQQIENYRSLSHELTDYQRRGVKIAVAIENAILMKKNDTDLLRYAIEKGNSEAVECILQMVANKDAQYIMHALYSASHQFSSGNSKQPASQSMIRERFQILYHLLKAVANSPSAKENLPYFQPALDFFDEFYLSDTTGGEGITASQMETASKIGMVLFFRNHPIFLAKYDIKREDDLSIVEYFILKKGVNPNIQDNEGATLFHRATASGNLKAMSALIKLGADPHMPYDEAHPIFISTQFRSDETRLSIIKFFLELGVDINIEDSKKHTLIACAASCGELDTLNGLVELGADVNKLVNGRHPIFFASQWCDWQPTLQFFLNRSFDINTEDPLDGDTLLIKTMKRRDVNNEDVQFLLERGADLRLANSRGESGVSIANDRDISGLLDFIPDPDSDSDQI